MNIETDLSSSGSGSGEGEGEGDKEKAKDDSKTDVVYDDVKEETVTEKYEYEYTNPDDGRCKSINK